MTGHGNEKREPKQTLAELQTMRITLLTSSSSTARKQETHAHMLYCCHYGTDVAFITTAMQGFTGLHQWLEWMTLGDGTMPLSCPLTTS